MTEEDDDHFVACFRNGRHEILEKVLLSLPARDMAKVQQVSPDWKEAINFYLETPNHRVEKIRSMRLRQEWIDNDPRIERIQLRLGGHDFSVLKVYDMIADDNHMAVGALAVASTWPRRKNCVFIVDARSLELVQVLDAEDGAWLDSNDYTWMKLTMNDKFLAANIGCSKPVGRSFAQSDQPIWVRNNSYRKSDQKFVNFILPPCKSNVSQDSLVTEHLRLKPSLSSTGFYFLMTNYSNLESQGARFDHFQAGKEGKFSRGENVIVEKETQEDYVEYQLVPGPAGSFGAILVESGDRFGGLVEGCVSLLRENRDNVAWERKNPGLSPKLIGSNENHAVVVWTDRQKTSREVEVLELADGKVVASVDCRQHFLSVDVAQTCDGRLAIGGETSLRGYDVIVWDLKSRSLIQRCSDRFQCLEPSSSYLMLKNRLLFADGQTIYSANFWI